MGCVTPIEAEGNDMRIDDLSTEFGSRYHAVANGMKAVTIK